MWKVALALVASLPAQSTDEKHEREFDFWIGEWNVRNRNLQGGAWRESGASRARIRSILAGKALLEEWEGKSGRHRTTFGISIRSYDPKKRRWVIVLNWPNRRNAPFGRMEGTFRHGRGEFFPPPAFAQTPPRAQRFTFSDALPNTCRWDQALPVGNTAWNTTWIMEFTRVAEAERSEPKIQRPPKRPVCRHAEARQFDVLIGKWKGKGTRIRDGKSEPVAAKFSASSANRGCATLCWLDVGSTAGKSLERNFEAWAWNTQHSKWVASTIGDRVPAFFELRGKFAEDEGVFVRVDRKRRVRYVSIESDSFRCLHEESDGAGGWRSVLDIAFERE